jgi:acetyltransferase-like isoleucine patch superfamily enzyme
MGNTAWILKDTIENGGTRDVLACEGRLRLGPAAKVMAGTKLEAPVFVAAGARVLTGVTIGAYTYVGRNSIVTRASIGRYCSIAHDCQINYFRAHPTDWLSTHPYQYDGENFSFWPGYAKFGKRFFDGDASQAHVTISSDVWLGADVHIFGGVTLGPGSIVGARSMVRDDVDAYAIVTGIPTTLKRYRFDPETIARLLSLKWWDLPEERLRSLPFDDVAQCLQLLEKAEQPKT